MIFYQLKNGDRHTSDNELKIKREIKFEIIFFFFQNIRNAKEDKLGH